VTGRGDGLLLAKTDSDSYTWTRLPTESGARNAVAEDLIGVWIVGDAGSIERISWWGGQTINTKTSYASGTTANLNGVAFGLIPGSHPGVQPTPVIIAVGDNGTSVSWNSVTNLFSSDVTPTTGNLHGIWGADYQQFWAVGDGPVILERSATTAWGAVTLPSTTATRLTAISGFSSSDAWAGGDKGVLLHYNGTSWSVTSSGTTADITSLSTPAANLAWATTSTGEVLAWNGSAWQIALVGDGHPLTAVSASAAGNVSVFGGDGTAWWLNSGIRHALVWEAPTAEMRAWATSTISMARPGSSSPTANGAHSPRLPAARLTPGWWAMGWCCAGRERRSKPFSTPTPTSSPACGRQTTRMRGRSAAATVS